MIARCRRSCKTLSETSRPAVGTTESTLVEELAGVELHVGALPRRRPRRPGSPPLATMSTCFCSRMRSIDDALVGRHQVLLRMEGDGALPDLRLGVAGELLVLLRRQLGPGLAVVARLELGELALLLDAAGDVDAVVRVVDRQGPADRFDHAVLRDARVGDDAQGRHDGLGDAAEALAVGAGPDRRRLHAPRAVLELHLGERRHLLDELRAR